MINSRKEGKRKAGGSVLVSRSLLDLSILSEYTMDKLHFQVF